MQHRPNPAVPEVDEGRLAAARVEALYAYAKPAYVSTLVIAAIMLVVLWGPLTVDVLVAWFLAVAAVTLGRVALHWGYARTPSEGREPLLWERRFVLGALAGGCIWAFVPIVLFPASEPLLQAVLVFVVIGSGLGAVGVYGSSTAAFYAFITLPLLATLLQLATQPGRSYQLLATMVIVFMLVAIWVYRGIHRSVVELIEGRLRNEALSAGLGASEARLRDAIESSPAGIAVFDQADRMVICNDPYARTYGAGRTAGQLAGVLHHEIALEAFAVEADDAALGRGFETWFDERMGRQQADPDAVRTCRLRDGRWLQSRIASTRAGGRVSLFTDVTEVRRAEEAYRTLRDEESLLLASLASSESMYRNLVETSNDLIWSLDRDGCWTYVNSAAVRRTYHRDAAELLGRPLREVLAPEVADRDLAVFRRVLEGEPVYDFETRHVRSDGVHVDLSFNAIPLRDARGAVVGTTGTARDITEQKRAAAALHESVEKLRLAADAADLYYWEWNIEADTLQWARDPSALIGGPDERTLAWPDLRTLIHPDDRERYSASARRARETGETYRCEYRVVTLEGDTRWISAQGKVVRGRDAAARMLGASRDITDAKRREEEVRFLAYHDTLTGLPNRRLLDDRLKQAVYQAQRRDGKVGVMLVDLDEFKQVNDSLGHRAGDAVLREVSRRLAGCVRKADTLARQGGDEFVVVVPDLALESDCQAVAEKILRALEGDCVVDGRPFRIGASIGIALFPADAGDGEGLLRNADAAMYRAKQLGRDNYRFFSR